MEEEEEEEEGDKPGGGDKLKKVVVGCWTPSTGSICPRRVVVVLRKNEENQGVGPPPVE